MSKSLEQIRSEAKLSLSRAQERRANPPKRRRWEWPTIIIATLIWGGLITFLVVRAL
jgi:hypothetical protein